MCSNSNLYNRVLRNADMSPNAGTGWGSRGVPFCSFEKFPILTPPISEFNEQQSTHTIVFCVLWSWGRAFTDLSTQSESLEQWLEAGASCPPTAYRKLLYVATPTPPRLLVIGAHMLHLLVCGSKHSIDLRQELPSRPPTANNLED